MEERIETRGRRSEVRRQHGHGDKELPGISDFELRIWDLD
jgi:hypothetical protein